MVLTNRKTWPSFSRTVAYLEFARGHDWREQSPVRLYSFLQKFCVVVLGEEMSLVNGLQRTGPLIYVLDFVGAELLVDHGPDYIVALHGEREQRQLCAPITPMLLLRRVLAQPCIGRYRWSSTHAVISTFDLFSIGGAFTLDLS